LIARGADVNALGPDNVTPLHWAAVESKLEIVTILLDKGADANAKTTKGQTPLDITRKQEIKDVLMSRMLAESP
jgi:ankyrin repeat protein